MEGDPAEGGPDDGGYGDHGQVAGMAVRDVQVVDAGCGSGEADAGCQQGAGDLSAFESGDGDELAALEKDGQGEGVGEDASVGCDGEACHADRVEKDAVDGDREQSDDGAGNRGCERVARGVEGSGVDALRGPEGERDGEDGEVLRGLGGVDAVEGASAEEIDDGRGEGDHPGGGDERGGEDARDGSVDGTGEVGEAMLAEE